ncbi:hypothetical protein QAD02_016466 [Eretmocerus hayati]|uniref:Uncharacterized protein n=1 Tax=Eretmocerus hayati TaxID=131215 RepID=A0ACC2PAP0_9HYME|nr:hypothetical protein QAD02_016466 [Eretmocerus hayati]
MIVGVQEFQLCVFFLCLQTVTSLRIALDTSREELRKVKENQQYQKEKNIVGGGIEEDIKKQQEKRSLGEAVQRLALENHVLRGRLLDRSGEFSSDASTSPPLPSPLITSAIMDPNATDPPSNVVTADDDDSAAPVAASEDANIQEPDVPVDEAESDESHPPDDEHDEHIHSLDEHETHIVDEEHKLAAQGTSNESENESEELDDIELIFTTDDVNRDQVGLQEDLVSITDAESWQQHQQQQLRTPTPSEQHKSVLKIAQSKSADESLSGSACNGGSSGAVGVGEKSSSVEEAASSQSSSIDREESVDRFDESSSSRLNKMWSQCSVLVETDISKCGVLEEVDLQTRHVARRNTLAAPTAAYRPIIHREALATGRRKSAAPLRPLLDHGNGTGCEDGSTSASSGTRRESGAQTDISALPGQWRSESYLAHKVAHTFTTLPSKFALPAGAPGRLRLSDKTREARRVMLSDIGFTSMVPELSRSADHLCHDPLAQQQQQSQPHSPSGSTGHSCYGSRLGLRTPEGNCRRESWACRSGGPPSPSPCDCSRASSELCPTGLSRCRGSSLSSISYQQQQQQQQDLCCQGNSRRHSWRPGGGACSFDTWRSPSSGCGAITSSASTYSAHGLCGMQGSNIGSGSGRDHGMLREHHHHHHHHQLVPRWSSMPSSPTHVQPPSAALVARLAAVGSPSRKSTHRVTFRDCPMIRGSLPNLRSELLGDNSGDSTESLIDEAEDYLRRSIDSMLTFSSAIDHITSKHSSRRRRTRRHSDPDLFREGKPPRDARPYLPKMPRDLKVNHLVKVISPEGRILQGRVRYVGPVSGREEVHVGVELPHDKGSSDGTFHGRRYFDCEPSRALFVPFKKVVLAWCTGSSIIGNSIGHHQTTTTTTTSTTNKSGFNT